MRSKIHARKAYSFARRYGVRRSLAGVVATVVLATSVAPGAPPIQATLPPFYSFDGNSPSVNDGTVGAADILVPGPDNAPIVVIRGVDIGLGQAGDELDALSSSNFEVLGSQSFALLVSVDRATRGVVPPDPDLVNQGVPYNVADQAAKGQAAGDQFMSLTLYTRAGGPLPGAGGRAGDNDALLRNNYDEGGTDFGAKPETSAEESAAAASRGVPVPQDNVGCTSGTSTSVASRGPSGPGPIYFSASAASPSLQLLPGDAPSGANLYFNGDPGAGGGTGTDLYASFADLGLVQGDDISGVIVFDSDGAGSFDGIFNGQDQVIFTLATGSPSLTTIVPGTVALAADLFSVNAGGGAVLFAEAVQLGLGDPDDSIDAVDFLLCTDATACALLHGIRQPPIPAASTWGMIVMTILVLAIGTLVFMRRRVLAA